MTSERLGIARIVSEQSPYNLLDRRIEIELVLACQAHGVGVICWSPLAMGMLAGRYEQRSTGDTRAAVRGGIYAERVTDAGIRVGNAFAALARQHGLEPAQAASALPAVQLTLPAEPADLRTSAFCGLGREPFQALSWGVLWRLKILSPKRITNYADRDTTYKLAA